MKYSWPYPDSPPQTPRWRECTSTIDWCEENYLISPFFAEFINTITNAAFVALAVYAIRNVIRERHETRFLLTALGFGLVGIGSWLFHMTLQYEFQLLDELPMIYATCIPSWSMFSYRISRFAARWLAGFFLFIALAVTSIYLYIRDPAFHQAAYAILTASVLFRSIYLMRDEVKDLEARKHMTKTIKIGILTFSGGYLLWVVDNKMCGQLRSLRRLVGLPWGFFLELHGLWHSMRGFTFITNHSHDWAWRLLLPRLSRILAHQSPR